MSIELIERAARELAPFLDEVTFVGGATVALWLTDPAAAEPRPTKDVDLVVEVASRLAWHDFEARLRTHGPRPDMSSSVICRWRAGKGDELLLDVMPGDATLLGFENHWQRPALDHAVMCSLPSGRTIQAISPPSTRSMEPSSDSALAAADPATRTAWTTSCCLASAGSPADETPAVAVGQCCVVR